jgi:hypothetical protein
MTNSEAKQQAIIKAWGEWWKCIPDKTKEETLEHEGWSELDVFGNFDPADNPFISSDFEVTIRATRCGNVATVRPASLRGIEDNNGFTRIEPDGSNRPDLDDEDVEYEFSINFRPVKRLISAYSIARIWTKSKVYHFRKWEPSKPPIY